MAIDYQLQDQFLEEFFSGRFAQDFYLTGGTALARFYFHHRESEDLDLFTQNQEIDFAAVNIHMEGIIRKLGLKTVNQVVTNTYLQFIVENEAGQRLKVDLVKDVPVRFGDVEARGKIRLDCLENIGSNKVLAVFGRTDHKDFVDLYYILQETSLTFEYLIGLAKKKDLGLSEFYLANSIDQIQGVVRMPVLLKPLNTKKYLAFYKDLSKKLLLKIKPGSK